MFHGSAVARFAFIMTMGNRPPDAYVRHSAMYSKPWLDVAVNVRAPAADAPMAHDSAECSLSTCTYSAASSPASTISERRSTTTVCGVMGYAEITCGRASRTPSANASSPERNRLIGHHPRFRRVRRTMAIAPNRHTVTHTPHPLQKS